MPTQFVNIFSSCSPITASCILYTAATMSVGTEAPDGFYADGFNCYTVSSPHNSIPGNVSSVDSCPTPTPPLCSLPGQKYRLSAFSYGGVSYATFTYKDACGNTQNATVWEGQDQYVCVQCGAPAPLKTLGNGLRTPVGPCDTGGC